MWHRRSLNTEIFFNCSLELDPVTARQTAARRRKNRYTRKHQRDDTDDASTLNDV